MQQRHSALSPPSTSLGFHHPVVLSNDPHTLPNTPTLLFNAMFKLSIALALLPLFASAAPNGFSPSAMNLPRNARSVAFDEVNKRFIAFDHVGREIGVYGIDAALSKRVEGTCTPMSNADIGKRKSHPPCHFVRSLPSRSPRYQGSSR